MITLRTALTNAFICIDVDLAPPRPSIYGNSMATVRSSFLKNEPNILLKSASSLSHEIASMGLEKDGGLEVAFA